MLLCGETVTLARRTASGYTLTVMEGASWFSRKGTERERAGEAVSGVTRVRIPERSLAAAPRGGAGEAGGNATTEDVCFVFASEAAVPMSSVWRAELSVPASAAGSEPLSIQVTDARGEAAGDGLLAIANTVLMVTGGAATIPFDRFLVGIKDSNVSYQRNGGASVPGSLVFF